MLLTTVKWAEGGRLPQCADEETDTERWSDSCRATQLGEVSLGLQSRALSVGPLPFKASMLGHSAEFASLLSLPGMTRDQGWEQSISLLSQQIQNELALSARHGPGKSVVNTLQGSPCPHRAGSLVETYDERVHKCVFPKSHRSAAEANGKVKGHGVQG